MIDYIKLVSTQDATHFEARLQGTGLLSGLEQAGILPIPERHNPYHFEREAEQHYQWEREHPEDEEQLRRDFVRREEILKSMEIGAILQRYFRLLPSPKPSPEEFADSSEARQDSQEHFRKRVIKLVKGGAFEDGLLLEVRLEDAGLLSRLEEASILVVVENPNPYDHRHEEEHEQWWRDYPEEEEKFSQAVERRDEILKYLCFGSVFVSYYSSLSS